jgi:integrase
VSNSINLLPSKLTIYRRSNSGRWQCRYKIKSGEWQRESTQELDVDEAKDKAFRLYYGAEERHKQKLPQNTRQFKQVAQYAVQRMTDELSGASGKVVYKDYIRTIENYLIPYFGRYKIDSIRVKHLQEYAEWRDKQIGIYQRQKKREGLKKQIRDYERLTFELKKLDAIPISFTAKQSTINTHNSALNRIFDEALLRGWITESIKPTLLNKGVKSESRGTFSLEEYTELTTAFQRSWWKRGNDERMQHLRKVLREYVLILANTGMRHGTEALGIKWRDIAYYKQKNEEPYFEFNVDGKRGKRHLIARDGVARFLNRLKNMDVELAHKSVEQIVKAQLDKPLFTDLDGDVVKADALRALFKRFLVEHNLLTGSDGKTRTLYSLRHMYATFGLLNGRDIYVMALQMGTSVKMLETFYSKLQPRAKAKELSGRLETIKRAEETDAE